jgi:excisionase family DNA binding protein
MNENNAGTGERNYARTTTVVGPVLLTALQAAEMLAVGRTSVYELIAAGDLETVHIGRSMRIPAESVHAFVAVRRCRP